MNIQLYRRETFASLQLALPLITSQILSFSHDIVDTVMAGQKDTLTLASVALATQIWNVIFLLLIGSSIAMSSAISRYNAQDDRQGVRTIFQQGFWVNCMLFFVCLLFFRIARHVPAWLGSNPDIAAGAIIYLDNLAIATSFYVVALSLRFFLEGMAFPRPILIMQVVMLPLNMFGNYVLLHGWWIFPELGIQGMAISTSITFMLFFFSLLYYLSHSERWKKYRLFHAMQAPHYPEIRWLLRIGIPISLASCMEAGLFSAIGLVISRMDEVSAAANQIALNFSGITFTIPLGISYALTIRIANAYGLKDRRLIAYRGFGGIAMGGGFMIFSALLILFFHNDIVQLYNRDPQVVTLAGELLLIAAIFQFFDGVQICATGVLRGLHDTTVPMIFSFIGYWLIGFNSALLLTFAFDFGVYGLWFGFVFGLFISACCGTGRFIYLLKNRLK